VNDSPDPVAGQLVVRRQRFDGTLLGELETRVEVTSGQAKRCLDTAEFGPISLRNEFLHASFASIDSTYLLIGERYLHLPKARLTVQCIESTIQISTDNFARQVTLQMEGLTGAVFEDNFFDMVPGQTRSLAAIEPAGGSQVNVRALNAEQIQVYL
jgi:hypothetical protein